MDFHQSINNVKQKLEKNNLFVKNGKNSLSLIVENKFEIILTHYPLWNNEQFLYMIGCLENKTILKQHITEKNMTEIVLEISKCTFTLTSNENFLN